ncbi:heme exporter protein CcmB [Roseivirga sp.]|uniref:heme exporter protein CcmB n=1 Tax=Roseivirga sp. TaxID=1964215 RepID=UPI003B51F840
MNNSLIFTLIGKEFRSEWRQKYALNGMVLYLASTIFVCYMSFNLKVGTISPLTWNALFWIIILFAGVNSVAKSFIQEANGRLLYYYSIAKPEQIIVSKTIYYALLMMGLTLVGYFFYSAVMGNPVFDKPMFLVTILLASTGFASALTMLSGIASKAPNSSTLIAVLSFPVIIPMLLVIIKCSRNAIDGIDRAIYLDQILTLVGINAIIIAVSYLLFPYLWRS